MVAPAFRRKSWPTSVAVPSGVSNPDKTNTTNSDGKNLPIVVLRHGNAIKDLADDVLGSQLFGLRLVSHRDSMT